MYRPISHIIMFHMKRFTSAKQKIGSQGETICATWLGNNGYTILERNYTISLGEIDIVAVKNNILHFIEVKSIQYDSNKGVSYETIYNPAENLTPQKLKRCYRTILHYLGSKNVSRETYYQFDLYMIYIDSSNKSHKIKRIENIIYDSFM